MNEYKIKLNGLKDGSYSNSFTIRGEFFEAFNTSEIKFVDIDIDTMLKVENKRFDLQIKSKGIVKDIQIHNRICEEIKKWFEYECNCEVLNILESPIKGPKGNTEFLLTARYQK